MFVRLSTFRECLPLLELLWENLDTIYPIDNLHTIIDCGITSPEVNIETCKLTYCVVEHRNKLIGCSHSFLTSESELRIRGTFILPEYRKCGLGGKMISFLINRNQTVNKVYTFPRVGTEKFYESLGFIVSEKSWNINKGVRYAEKLL